MTRRRHLCPANFLDSFSPGTGPWENSMKASQTLLPVKTIRLGALMAGTLACGSSAKSMPAAAGTMPTVAPLAPASATAGGAAFTLTVSGTNVGSTAVVNWNGTAQHRTPPFEAAIRSSWQFRLPPSPPRAPVRVTVANPGSPGTGLYRSGARWPRARVPRTSRYD